MKTLTLVSAALLIFSLPALVQSQDCSTVADEALRSAASCIALGPNEICYGHGKVDSLVNCEEAPEFDSLGDILPIDALCSLRSSAWSDAGEWGLAVMRVQPTNTPQPISMIVIGEVEMQNAASALNALEVRADSDLAVLSGPGSSFETLKTLSAGEVVRANACNCTGNWLRTVLQDGRVGWIPSRQVTVMGDAGSLPVVDRSTPVYATMQAFTLVTGDQPRACPEVPADGVLVQVPADGEAPLLINGIPIVLSGSAFVQSHPNSEQTITVLSGEAVVTVDQLAAHVPAGTRAVIPMSENLASGGIHIEPFDAADVAALPLALLPEPVEISAGFDALAPSVVGMKPCRVISNAGETLCPIHFVNRDGDAITQMTVESVSAPYGDWTGSVKENPVILEGDYTSGALSWEITCSTGDACFIGPIVWSITLTDAAGNVSAPFEVTFNCVSE
ncbi:MAG: hypothetical protein IPK19_06170 [Chloroflexi bacterium]|nr:hypothetical protein [Chloroflexota bacterium]